MRPYSVVSKAEIYLNRGTLYTHLLVDLCEFDEHNLSPVVYFNCPNTRFWESIGVIFMHICAVDKFTYPEKGKDNE